MLCPVATHPDVTRQGTMIFRSCSIDPMQGTLAARFALQDPNVKVKTAAILSDPTAPYCASLASEFEKEFVKEHGVVVLRETYQEGDQDFRSQLVAIRERKPDVLFLPGYYTDVDKIVPQARKLGIEIPLVGGDGWESPALTKVDPTAFDKAYFVSHYSALDPNPKNQEFVKRYATEYHQTPEGLAGLSYEATCLLADALKRAKSLSSADIAAELAKTRDFDGLIGKATIDPERNAIKSAVVLELKNGAASYHSTVSPKK